MCVTQNHALHRATTVHTGRVRLIQKARAKVPQELIVLQQNRRAAAGATALPQEAGAAVQGVTAAADHQAEAPDQV